MPEEVGQACAMCLQQLQSEPTSSLSSLERRKPLTPKGKSVGAVRSHRACDFVYVIRRFQTDAVLDRCQQGAFRSPTYTATAPTGLAEGAVNEGSVQEGAAIDPLRLNQPERREPPTSAALPRTQCGCSLRAPEAMAWLATLCLLPQRGSFF